VSNEEQNHYMKPQLNHRTLFNNQIIEQAFWTSASFLTVAFYGLHFKHIRALKVQKAQ